MKPRNSRVLLPAVLSAGSFLGLVLLVLLTNPLKNISYAILFFGILLVLLFNIGHLWLYLATGKVSSKSRLRIITISIFLVVLIMFRSAQSLSWIDVLVVAFLSAGLLFYSSRRSR